MVKEAVIPKGYSQTDVGVIPNDWKVKRLGELFDISSSKRVFQNEWKSEGVPFYRARELAVLAEKGEVKNDLFISKEMYDAYKKIYGVPQIGDMLVTGVGTLGKVYVVSDKHEFYFKDGNIIWFKIAAKVSPDFLKQLYIAPVVIKQIEDNSAGTTVGTYTISGAKKTVIPLPPLPEQAAIATTLSDTDKLIAILERLIIKKRNIRQGAMQELLTGKRRLPGFSEKWEVISLGKVAEFMRGRALSKSDMSEDGNYKCVHYGQLFTEYKELIREVKSRTNKSDGYFYSKDNDVLMPTSDVTPRGLATASCIRENGVILGGGILVIRLHSGYDGLYLSYFIALNKTSILKLVKGSTVFHLYANDLANLEVQFPSLKEQIAITKVLNDIDIEIETLEQKLAKYQMLKKGMTQVLLTGKVRLI